MGLVSELASAWDAKTKSVFVIAASFHQSRRVTMGGYRETDGGGQNKIFAVAKTA